MPSVRKTLRWMTAADERAELVKVNEQIAGREAKQKSPKQAVLNQRHALRVKIFARLGTELVLVGVLLAATAAKITGVFSGDKPQDGQAGQVEGGAQVPPLAELDFDQPGMMKTFVLVNLPPDQKDVDALHDKIGDALKLALQDQGNLETYRTEDIDIIITPNVAGSAQAAVERAKASGAAGIGVDFRSWSGDALTFSTKERGKPVKHLTFIDEKLMQDPVKLAAAIDHELGHIGKRKGGVAMTSVTTEEIDVFTASIARLRTLVLRLRATNGPNDPTAERLEREIIPREEDYLRGWSSKKK